MGKIPTLCARLRKEIIDGTYAPGDRIPPQAELLKSYAVSSVTMQAIITQLSDEGFIEARGRSGTFVTDKPPHLSRIAILDPQSQDNSSNSFFRLVREQAPAIAAELDCSLRFHHAYDSWRDLDDYSALLEEIESDQLAGLIFLSRPYALRGTPLLTHPDLPRIAFMSGPGPRGVDTVWVDYDHMLDSAFRRCAERGCRRLGVLTTEAETTVIEQFMTRNLHGLELQPHWVQSTALNQPDWAGNQATLLMALPADRRPDCLVITNDNLVPSVTAALKQLGLRLPDDLLVIGHANQPWPLPAALPITRIGFQLDEILRHCMRTIIRRRRGEKTDRTRIMPACFDDEAA